MCVSHRFFASCLLLISQDLLTHYEAADRWDELIGRGLCEKSETL